MDEILKIQNDDDFFANDRFLLTFDKFGDVAFKCKNIVTPDISLGETPLPTIYRMVPVEGDEVTYGTLEVSFICDKTLKNYMMLYKWINSSGFADNMEQFPEIQKYIDNDGKITTNATILFLDSDFKPFLTMELGGVFPIALNGLSLDNSSNVYDPGVLATASFRVQTVQFSRPATNAQLL